MKPRFLLTVALAVSTIYAQMHDNREKQMTCENNGDSARARHCEIREQTFPGPGRLTVDGGMNGGVTIKGWLRNDALVRSKIETWGETQSDANNFAGQVRVDAGAGQVHATGPAERDRTGWSVSYEIFVPQTTDLDLKTHNGGIHIADVRGQIRFEAVNGGVHLSRIAGDVSGSTVNGGLHVELTGASWEGRQLEANTENGGVTIDMPENYSAHIRTETVNGGIRSEFPVTVRGRLDHNLDFNVGTGGPLIHVSTTNGGVRIKRS